MLKNNKSGMSPSLKQPNTFKSFIIFTTKTQSDPFDLKNCKSSLSDHSILLGVFGALDDLTNAAREFFQKRAFYLFHRRLFVLGAVFLKEREVG